MKKTCLIRRLVLITGFIVLTSFLGACDNNSNISFLNIGYKNPNANYGLFTVFDHEKMYFKDSSAIYFITPQDNQVNKLCPFQDKGQLFAIDQNTAYTIDYPLYGRYTRFKITSVNLDGTNKKKVAQYSYSSPHDPEPYYVHNGQVYMMGYNTCFKGNTIEEGTLYNIPSNASVIKPPDQSFTLYKLSDKLALISKESSFTSLLDIKTNISFPYNTVNPQVLTYVQNSDQLYIYHKYKIYRGHGKTINVITQLASQALGYLLFFSEDENSIYLILGDKDSTQQFFKVDKNTGSYQVLYQTNEHENFVALMKQYAFVYKQGVLYKYQILDDQLHFDSKLVVNDDKINAQLNIEQCNRYLYFQSNKIQIINLDSMNVLGTYH
jgi:hypothetical protein